jgi:hypothetical protein
MNAQLTTQQGDVLFHKLCMDLGFCLRPDYIAQLLKDQPEDIYSFTNAVFAAEGMNPERADRDLWRRVRGYVAEAFEEAPASRHPSIL